MPAPRKDDDQRELDDDEDDHAEDLRRRGPVSRDEVVQSAQVECAWQAMEGANGDGHPRPGFPQHPLCPAVLLRLAPSGVLARRRPGSAVWAGAR